MATEVIDTSRFQTLFESLQTQKSLLTTCTEQWRKLSAHFTSLELSLAQKTKTLDSKIETLDSETKKTFESLEKRENSIPDQESKAIARVEEQKQIALSEFDKPIVQNADLGDSLRSYCRKMDSRGLLRYIMCKRKETATLKTEIGLAIREAVDPPRLVLDAVEEFVTTQKTAKAGVSDRRWACGMLLSGLFPGEEKAVAVAGKIGERAQVVAEAWKGKIEGDQEEGGVGHVEATMFLQMVVGFGLQSNFDGEFLKKLVLEYPSRRDMPKLASGLGFGEKLGDIIDELAKNGKEIEAIYFACECGLTERFPPVPLLKTYLRNSRKNATTILKNGNYNMSATDEANTLELNSIKNIIRCVEDQKLESQFTLGSLKHRASQLEKLKVDRKKNVAANKRGRGSGGPTPYRPAKSGRVSNPYPSYGHRNTVPAHQNPVGAYSAAYNYSGHGAYDTPPAASYTSHYTRGPAAPPQSYTYPPEDMGSRVSGSYGGQTSYGAYSSVPPNSYPPSYPQ